MNVIRQNKEGYSTIGLTHYENVEEKHLSPFFVKYCHLFFLLSVIKILQNGNVNSVEKLEYS